MRTLGLLPSLSSSPLSFVGGTLALPPLLLLLCSVWPSVRFASTARAFELFRRQSATASLPSPPSLVVVPFVAVVHVVATVALIVAVGAKEEALLPRSRARGAKRVLVLLLRLLLLICCWCCCCWCCWRGLALFPYAAGGGRRPWRSFSCFRATLLASLPLPLPLRLRRPLSAEVLVFVDDVKLFRLLLLLKLSLL